MYRCLLDSHCVRNNNYHKKPKEQTSSSTSFCHDHRIKSSCTVEDILYRTKDSSCKILVETQMTFGIGITKRSKCYRCCAFARQYNKISDESTKSILISPSYKNGRIIEFTTKSKDEKEPTMANCSEQLQTQFLIEFRVISNSTIVALVTLLHSGYSKTVSFVAPVIRKKNHKKTQYYFLVILDRLSRAQLIL
jgi:hypothetical protein